MNKIEAGMFLDNEVRSRYPEWSPADTDVVEWVVRLQRYDQHKAKYALREWWFAQTRRFKLPTPATIFKAIAKAYIQTREGPEASRIRYPFGLRRVGETRVCRTAHVGELPPAQELERWARRYQAEFESAYSGKWEVVWLEASPEVI